MSFEHRSIIEIRASGRTIRGIVMRYGERATVVAPGGRVVRETFQAGAFTAYLREFRTALNLQHDGTVTVAHTGADGRLGRLELTDSATELRMAATLPDGDVFDRVLELVAGGALHETSVEFRALVEQLDGDLRTIDTATLPAIGLVDAGAYRGAVEVRNAAPRPRRRRPWL